MKTTDGSPPPACQRTDRAMSLAAMALLTLAAIGGLWWIPGVVG